MHDFDRGMIGQYPFAAVVGKVIDRFGPWSCSLASSILFSLGFGLFALEIAKTPDDITVPSKSSFERLALFYFMAGLGTVTSYFSSLFAASKNFPDYIGIASGTSMALFGLSPLFLSVMASEFFTNEETGLDVTHFVAFMAALAGIVHIIGAINLRTPNISAIEVIESDNSQDDEESVPGRVIDEREPLIRHPKPKNGPIVQVAVMPVEHNQTVLDLLRDPHFWLLAVSILVCLGSVCLILCSMSKKCLTFRVVRNGNI